MIFKGKIIKHIFNNNGELFAQLNYAKKFYTKYAKHSHDTLCISIIKQGKIVVEFHNKEKQTLYPNQIVIFNPHQVHVTKNSNIKSYNYYTLHLTQKWIDKISPSLYFKNNIINSQNYYEIFLNLCENIIQNNIKDIEKELYNFFIDLVENHSNNISTSTNNQIFNNVKNYIINNIQEQLTLDDIAKEIGYSKEYIIRIFKKEFGLTPHAFLMNEKVNYAKNILDKSDSLNLTEIALELGFYDQSHFIKFFKKSFAITPNKYKKDI